MKKLLIVLLSGFIGFQCFAASIDFVAQPGKTYWLESNGAKVSNDLQSLEAVPVALRLFYDDGLNVELVENQEPQGELIALPNGWDRISNYPTTSHLGHGFANLYEIAHFSVSGEIEAPEDAILRVAGDKEAIVNQPTKLHALAVKGVLVVNDNLELETLTIYPEGQLIVNSGTISFTGNIDKDPSQSAVGLFSVGTVHVNGVANSNFALLDKLDATRFQGNFSGWQTGDVVVFPDTQEIRTTIYSQRSFRTHKSQIEYRTVVAIDGDVITIDSPLQWDHKDVNLNKWPIADTSSSVTFQTKPGSVKRAHALFAGHEPVRIYGATFLNMGRTTSAKITAAGGSNQIGRYPIHAHHNHDFEFVDVVVVNSPRHGIVHHNSDGKVINCLVVDAMASGIFSEEGREQGLWDNNVVFSACYNSTLQNDDAFFGAFAGKELGSGGFSYWLRTHNVRVQNNVAYGFALSHFASFTHPLFNLQADAKSRTTPLKFSNNYFYGSAESSMRIQYNDVHNTIDALNSYNLFLNCRGLDVIHSRSFEFIDSTLFAKNGWVAFARINGTLELPTLELRNSQAVGNWKSLLYNFILKQ